MTTTPRDVLSDDGHFHGHAITLFWTSHPNGCDHEPQAQDPDSVTTNERLRMMIVRLFSPSFAQGLRPPLRGMPCPRRRDMTAVTSCAVRIGHDLLTLPHKPTFDR
jgi:hypothetical protein